MRSRQRRTAYIRHRWCARLACLGALSAVGLTPGGHSKARSAVAGFLSRLEYCPLQVGRRRRIVDDLFSIARDTFRGAAERLPCTRPIRPRFGPGASTVGGAISLYNARQLEHSNQRTDSEAYGGPKSDTECHIAKPEPPEPDRATHQESSPSQRNCRNAGHPNGRHKNVDYSPSKLGRFVALLRSSDRTRSPFNERHGLSPVRGAKPAAIQGCCVVTLRRVQRAAPTPRQSHCG
jgi:hypothetical protein